MIRFFQIGKKTIDPNVTLSLRLCNPSRPVQLVEKVRIFFFFKLRVFLFLPEILRQFFYCHFQRVFIFPDHLQYGTRFQAVHNLP